MMHNNKTVKSKEEDDWTSDSSSDDYILNNGLENLSTVNEIHIIERVGLLRRLNFFYKQSKYKIKNVNGQQIFRATEESSFWSRWLFGSLRSFNIKILDKDENEVIHMYRPLKCTGFCFPCCLQRLEVCSPPGVVIGVVEEVVSFPRKQFLIKNNIGVSIFHIKAPCFTTSLCNNVAFTVFSFDGVKVGKITRRWSGVYKEFVTTCDSYIVKFPLNLDVNTKALIIASTFLINMLYFDK